MRDGVTHDSYNFALVPSSARVGYQVASFTSCRVLFLIEQIVKVQDREINDLVRTRLPWNEKAPPDILHCRLRGECRVNAFEDTWNPGYPMMLWGGYVQPQWDSAIFVIY
jgi:hypothetical protein